ncbi:bis(5'-adenosyl)-triphosphatase [Carpediemonas membranifera]|uniref:Bis(5'-adenosyl)-triphosphatase n=1 Tax=Carpediemonas membranifera TaxID=201153 RepID=A0A8J6EAY2_9EUKA|nr:bis(5'-adenosyl)-triphosphatase [Carpediemonas membranifera]|eukprot:KAG9395695.1 bis(5'-adenosyl)-triphosphatase [Carpediemonas membranifera]
MPETSLIFEKFSIDSSIVIFEDELAFCTLSFKPITPGHILVIPKRIEQYYDKLSADEVRSMAKLVTRCSGALKRALGCKEVTFGCQDGPHAGQTVKHVHIHVIPAYDGGLIDDDDRKQWSVEKMAKMARRIQGVEVEP